MNRRLRALNMDGRDYEVRASSRLPYWNNGVVCHSIRVEGVVYVSPLLHRLLHGAFTPDSALRVAAMLQPGPTK